MPKRKKLLWLSLVLIQWIGLPAQNNPKDSLLKVLKNSSYDSIKLMALDRLIEFEEDSKTIEIYNKQLKNIAESNLSKFPADSPRKRQYLSFLADGLSNDGFLAYEVGEVDKALHYFHLSLETREKTNDKQGIANSLSNLSIIYNGLGKVKEGLDCAMRALKLLEEIKFEPGIATACNNIGYIYENQDQHEDALKYFKKSLPLQRKIGDKEGEATTLNNIGAIYKTTGNVALAKQNINGALKIRKEIQDKHGIGQSLYNLGLIAREENKINEAFDYYKEALTIQEEISDKQGMSYIYNSMAGAFLSQENFSSAKEYANKGLVLGKELGYPDNISNAAEILTKIFKKENRPSDALAMFELYVKMRDSINNGQTRKAAIKSQLKYEFDKKALADSIRAMDEKKIKDAKIQEGVAKLKQEQTMRYALYGGLALVIIFSVFIYNRFTVTRKQKDIIEMQKHVVEEQKELVEEKQKEILDSIKYAKRIQRALIPSEKYIGNALKRLMKNG